MWQRKQIIFLYCRSAQQVRLFEVAVWMETEWWVVAGEAYNWQVLREYAMVCPSQSPMKKTLHMKTTTCVCALSVRIWKWKSKLNSTVTMFTILFNTYRSFNASARSSYVHHFLFGGAGHRLPVRSFAYAGIDNTSKPKASETIESRTRTLRLPTRVLFRVQRNNMKSTSIE